MFFDQIAKSTTVNELDTAVLGESGDSRPFGYLLKDRVLDVDDFLEPCVGCWGYSPIYIRSECSTGPGLVDYCYRPSRGAKAVRASASLLVERMYSSAHSRRPG